jgi:hypothetical protein
MSLLRAAELKNLQIAAVPHGQRAADYNKLFQGVPFRPPVVRLALEADVDAAMPPPRARRKGTVTNASAGRRHEY